MADLKNVEILKAGVWNNTKISETDLEDIVNNYEKVGFKPPIKLGHTDDPGERAYGWISRIWKEGNKLLADFSDIPDKVFAAIKDHGYDAVSSEIYFNLKRGESVFRRALGAVALLGSRIPAVAGLKPLRESLNLSAEDSFDSVFVVNLEHNKGDHSMSISKEEFEKLQADMKALQDQNTELAKSAEKLTALEQANQQMKTDLEKRDAAIELLRKDNRSRSVEAKLSELSIPAYRDLFRPLYSNALEAGTEVKFSVGEEKDLTLLSVLDKLVEKINADSKEMFSEHSTDGGEDRKHDAGVENVAEKVDQLAEAYSKEHKVDYSEALMAVLNDKKNSELKEKYLQ